MRKIGDETNCGFEGGQPIMRCARGRQLIDGQLREPLLASVRGYKWPGHYFPGAS